MPALRRFFGRMADVLWPRTCAVESCGRPSDRPGSHICSRCFAALPFIETSRSCSCCGLPVEKESRQGFVCEECAAGASPFERARSALSYSGDVEGLVKAFKYGGATHLADDFASLMAAALRSALDAAAVDVVVPVPLHPHRLRERGFNQSALLAEGVARRIGRRFDGKSFVRVRDTQHQARLGGEERRKNLHAAFAAKRPEYLRGRTVLLVDDVMTTRSTMNECANTLLAAGAFRVWCLTLARAAP